MTTATVHIELSTAFWLLAALIIAELILWSVLGSEKLIGVIKSGFRDAFGQ